MLAISVWALRPAVKCEIVIRNWKWEAGREVGNRKLVSPEPRLQQNNEWDDPLESLSE